MSALNTIPEAIEAIQKGEIIIVVDDEDREMKATSSSPQGMPRPGHQLHGHPWSRSHLRTPAGIPM